MMRKLVVVLALTLPAVCGARLLCAQGIEHLYVTNQAGSSISLYDMDSTTGGLVSVTNFATPRVPISLSFNSSGSYAYLASGGPSPAITTYAVNASTGSLTQVASVSVSAGALPAAEIDPSGNYLVVVDVRRGSVSTYHLNPDGSASAAGTLTASNPLGQIIFLPAAGVAYSGGPAAVLTRISLSSSTGAISQAGSMNLSALPPATPGSRGPRGKDIVLHPSGKYLYVVDPATRTVTGFSVDPTSGALTQFSGSAYSLSAFTPLGFAFAGSGDFLYFGNWRAGSIMGLKVNSDGSLSALQSAVTVTPFVTKTRRGGNVHLTTDPSGKFLYAISADTNQITGYSVDQTTGALTQISGLLLSTGNVPTEAVFAP